MPSCGPSLVWAIEQSPTWSWLFKGQLSQLKRLWISLNRLSWLWCSMQYVRVKALPQNLLQLSSQELHGLYHTADTVRRGLEANVTVGLRRLLGVDLYHVRPSETAGACVHFGFSVPQIRALCLFLPPTIVLAIHEKNASRFKEVLSKASIPQNSRECLIEAEDGGMDLEVSSLQFAKHDLWTSETAQQFLPFLAQAYKLLKQAYSAELLRLAELHEKFPGKLKTPFAPQTWPRNKNHVLEGLRRDAKRILTKPLRTPERILVTLSSGYDRSSYYTTRPQLSRPRTVELFNRVRFSRFRHPDTALIPFDWCFVLFEAVRRQYPLRKCASKYPQALLPALRDAEAGVRMIYHRSPWSVDPRLLDSILERVNEAGMPNTQRLEAIINKNAKYPRFLDHVTGLPKPLRELSWLKSFLTCVEWMENTFPLLAAICQGMGESDTSDLHLTVQDLVNDTLFAPPDYEKFVAEVPTALIASCILRDSKLCDENAVGLVPRPTPVALYLPDFSSPRGREIARHMVPAEVGIDLQELKYDSLKQKLTRFLLKAPKLKGHVDGYKLACDLTEEAIDAEAHPNGDQVLTCVDEPKTTPHNSLPGVTQSDVDVASRVLRYLLRCSPQPHASVADTLDLLNGLSLGAAVEAEEPPKEGTGTWEDRVKEYLTTRPVRSLPGNDAIQRCYMCRLRIHVPHKASTAMCIPCGDFNAAGSELSMPGNLNLSGKTALVTGARVNLGYHVALRLLRCGARVIASSRYPRDAALRYEAEPDSSLWIDRLRIVGADFRSARDAFDLVEQTRIIIAAWGGRLDILINNAAQTLTDSVETEEQAVHREHLLKDEVSTTRLIQHQQYSARVRGGAQATIGEADRAQSPPPDLSGSVSRIGQSTDHQMSGGVSHDKTVISSEAPALALTHDMLPFADRSSWMQSLSEIPYQDVISAHSVNTFVPLILIRELLPLMGDTSSPPPSSQDKPGRPAGYVINVSSREGIFESSPSSTYKAGRHVHTNMSKAALNMITETEAGPAWTRRRVAINTVDPGYMSAAPERAGAYDGVRPVGWEDGAGRVLWPVAIGEGAGGEQKGTQDGGVVWGRFLKHYGAVRVEPGWGRG